MTIISTHDRDQKQTDQELFGPQPVLSQERFVLDCYSRPGNHIVQVERKEQEDLEAAFEYWAERDHGITRMHHISDGQMRTLARWSYLFGCNIAELLVSLRFDGRQNLVGLGPYGSTVVTRDGEGNYPESNAI